MAIEARCPEFALVSTACRQPWLRLHRPIVQRKFRRRAMDRTLASTPVVDPKPKPPLLFLTQRIPYPLIKGEKIRHFHTIRYLRQRFDLYIGGLVDDAEDWQYLPTIDELARDTHFAKLDPRLAKLFCLRGLLSGQPLSFTYFENQGLRRWIDHVIQRVRPAVCFISSSNMAPYVIDHMERPPYVIMDFIDVDSEKWAAYATEARWPMSWVYRREHQRVAEAERHIAGIADVATFVSDAEANMFRELCPPAAQKTFGVANGVDSDYFSPDATRPPPFETGPATFVFTGSMDYPPNVQAVCFFAQQVLPKVRSSVGGARFFIVGARPAPAVEALAELDDVTVTGRVLDVRPYLDHATAPVAPMFIARGIQNKVLEAMAMAKPVIATWQALEGIELDTEREVVVANSADEFISAAIAAARGETDPAIGDRARQRVVEHYSWAARLSGFDRFLDLVGEAASGGNTP